MDIKVDDNTVIVFDLDDTLYNELDFLKSAYKEIAIYLDPDDWRRLYSKMFSLYRSKINVFEFVVNAYNTEIGLLVEMYRNHNPDIKLFDGVIEIFEAIKSRNGMIGIITDGRSITQRAKIESLGISHYIDSIIISEEIGSEKPNLGNFKAIENSLPGNIYYYIADNLKKDFVAPNILGWKSVCLIDNGKNVHFDSNEFMSAENLADEFMVDIRELIIM